MSFAQSQTNQAQAEGRRIYIGNLNYDLQTADVEDMLVSSGFPTFDGVKIPLDPASGRNRGYCFVDFSTRDEADRAITQLQAIIAGREIKVRPCEPKPEGRRDQAAGGGYNSNAYGGNASGQRWGNNYNRGGGAGFDAGGAPDDSRDMRKLYVGGIGPMPDQAQNEEEIRLLFRDFNPQTISKRLESTRANPENPGPYNFCFVDFETAEEANAAKDALDGRVYGQDGSQLRVSFAKPSRSQQSQGQGQQGNRWGRQQPSDGYNRGPQSSNMGGGSWRRQ